jgi:hypothetical protein
MNKQKLVKFIDKYNLGGLVNSAILSFKDNTLNTRFTSGDKSLLGILSMDNWDFEDGEFGVYNTEQLVKLLSVLDDDVTMSVSKTEEKAISIQLSDSVSKVNYMLTDTSVINRPPVPERFTVVTNNNSTNVVIGYASVNTNRVTIPVSTTEYKEMDLISFNASNFKEVLSANKECESALLEVSPDGIAKITFKIDNYKSTYYLVAVQDVD